MVKKPESAVLKSDPKAVEALFKAYVASYSKVSIETNIILAAQKFSQLLKATFKADSEASLRFDPSGKNTCPLDLFVAHLKTLSGGNLSQEEVLALSFIPVDATSDDLSMLSLKMYLF